MSWTILVVGIIMSMTLMLEAPDAITCMYIILSIATGMVLGVAIITLSDEGN